MNRVTLICCFNNKKQFDELKITLENQTEKHKLIAIDNTRKVFSSCSLAFNSVITQVETKYVIYLHQDILFINNNSVKIFTDYMEQMDENDILGVAGSKRGIDHVISNVLHGKFMEQAGKECVVGMLSVDVIDECFFGGYTECFVHNPFNEKLCKGWHLYAVERCLNALIRKNHVYVCDISLIHNSKGKINHAFNVDFYKISKYYAKQVNYIRTTCAYASTRFIIREWAYVKREISVMLNRY